MGWILKLIDTLLGRDELVGKWSTERESGLHIISGQALHLRGDGTGTHYSWNTSDPEYDDEYPVLWQRTAKRTLQIKYNKPGEAWNEITYHISPYQGAYGKYLMLTSPDYTPAGPPHPGFWTIYGELYRPDVLLR